MYCFLTIECDLYYTTLTYPTIDSVKHVVVSNSLASDLSYACALVQLCDHRKSSMQWYTTPLLLCILKLLTVPYVEHTLTTGV